MKTLFALFLYLMIISTVFAEIQPIGSLGKGQLKDIFFLPDGRILRVLVNRIEIVDSNMKTTLARFADRTEHMGKVTVSQDGSRLAVVRPRRSAAHTVIEVWELDSPRNILQRTIPKYLNQNALSPDLTVLAGHIDDGIIRFWNVETGESLGKIEWTEHYGFGRLAFSPNGRQLLSINSYIAAENLPGGYDRWESTIDTWDTGSHQRVWGRKHFYRIVRAAYSPDSRWIVTANANHRIATWDAKLGVQREIWHATDYVKPIQFSPDSRRVYVAAGTGGYPRQPNRVSAWDIETGEKLHEFGDCTIGLGSVSISPDEKHALLSYSGGYVVLWDIPEDRRIAFVTDYVVPRWGSISPDGRYLVSRGGAAINIWDIRSQSLLEVIFPVRYFVRSFAMAPRGQVFAADEDPWIEIRDLASGQIVSKIPNDGSTPFVFSSDGRQLARGERAGVLIYDLRDTESPEELFLEVKRHTSARQIAFSADDRNLAVSDWDDRVHLWEKQNLAYVFRYSWKIPASQIDDIAFEPKRENPALIVIGDLDQLQVWKLGETAPEPSIHFTARAPIRFVRVGAMSSHFHSRRLPGERDYLLVNGGRTLQVWDWSTKRRVAIPDIPRYFAASDDGSVVVTQDSVSFETRIWDVRSMLLPKPVQLGQVKKTALLPNYPNPFNPETWIPYQLRAPTDVRIRIHDVSGQLVRRLVIGARGAGDYLCRSKAAYWDGRNDTGETVGSGVYWYSIDAGGYQETRKMVIQR